MYNRLSHGTESKSLYSLHHALLSLYIYIFIHSIFLARIDDNPITIAIDRKLESHCQCWIVCDKTDLAIAIADSVCPFHVAWAKLWTSNRRDNRRRTSTDIIYIYIYISSPLLSVKSLEHIGCIGYGIVPVCRETLIHEACAQGDTLALVCVCVRIWVSATVVNDNDRVVTLLRMAMSHGACVVPFCRNELIVHW